jgi:CelD/BcsL family acetyltransferase involved in cellulose biosynthesis
VSPNSTGGLTVRTISEADAAAWTAFLERHPGATLYHTLPWRDVISEVFGHQPHYLLCERGGQPVGLLPLFLVRFPFLGSKLISLPYDVGSGGPLGDPVAETALVDHAIELARQLKVGFLEFRCGAALQGEVQPALIRSEPVVISDMELDARDKVWARVSTDNRQSIRKAQRRGVIVREAQSLEDFQAFYAVYLCAFREFGTPPYGERYFPAVWRRLSPSKAVRLLLAEVEGRVVGGLLLYCWQKNLVSKFAAALPEAVPLRAYAALYGRAIDLSLEMGAERLSWGTSSRQQQGLIEFKERWGATSRPAVFYDLAVRRRPPSIEAYYDSEGVTRKAWRRLPLPLTSVLGGWINRWFC